LSTLKPGSCAEIYSARARRRVRFFSLLILRRIWVRSWRASTVPLATRMSRIVFFSVKI